MSGARDRKDPLRARPRARDLAWSHADATAAP